MGKLTLEQFERLEPLHQKILEKYVEFRKKNLEEKIKT
jgi:hypothetical protein